jgi:acid phosphatase family membrane protein YuiD
MHTIGLLSLASGLAAQLLKVCVGLVRQRRLQLSLFFAPGGMPSSHTAVVTTLSLLVAEREGMASALFSVVLIFSLYVVLEATGLRQEVGKQAALINDLVDEMIATHHFDHRRLRELIGHTWAEVAGGGACGLATYLLSCWLR